MEQIGLQADYADSDQTPRSVASDLVLHCMPMSYKKDDMYLYFAFIL